MRTVRFAVPALMALVACSGPAPQPGPALPESTASASAASLDQFGDRPVIYVPAYSHVYHGGPKTQRFQLDITLSVHNTSFQDSIRLHKIHFYNADGHLERAFLDSSVTLRPMQTYKVQLAHKDSAGSGANFLIEWEGASQAKPIAEAVHVGISSTVGLSFVTRGAHLDPIDMAAGLPE